MAQLERKCFSTDVKAEGDQGIIEAIVSVFNNVDRGDEIVRPGFFAESLKRKLPKGVWHHRWEMPIAKTLEAREAMPGDSILPLRLKDLGGLYIKGQFNLDTQRGRESYSDIKFGIIDEFSIGYKATKRAYDEESDVTELLEGEIFEWSPVLVGTNRDTQLLSVKSDGSLAGLRLEDQSDAALAYLSESTERINDLEELRAKERRVISERNRTRISTCCEQIKQTVAAMQGAHDELSALMVLAEPRKKADQKAILNEVARFIRTSHSFHSFSTNVWHHLMSRQIRGEGNAC